MVCSQMAITKVQSRAKGRQPPRQQVSPATQARATDQVERRLPIGAELLPDGGTHFRVWAPNSRKVAVEILQSTDEKHNNRGARRVDLRAEKNGYFSGVISDAGPGTLYHYA